MSKKKKVEAPVYEQWAGNKYTDRARQGVGTYGNWVDNNWEDLTKTYTAEDMKDIAQKAYDTTWNDFLNSYRRQSNALASQNYNRFGGLGSTPSLYTTDMFGRQENDLASRLGSQMYGMADQLAGNQMNRNLASLNQVYGMYNNAGNIINALDQANWAIRNQNIEAKYVADLQNAQRSSGILDWAKNIIGGGTQGASNGFSVAGPWGALAGGIAGSVGGTLDSISGNPYNSQGSWTNVLAPQISSGAFGNLGNIGGNLNLNTKANQVATPTNYRTYMNF